MFLSEIARDANCMYCSSMHIEDQGQDCVLEI